LYAGGLVETIVGNQLFAVGPTFGAIIMEQFSRIKNADRFYYENGPSVTASAFTTAQLAQIKTVTMAGLVCRNWDIVSIQKYAFWVTNS
jgi:peroxidase